MMYYKYVKQQLADEKRVFWHYALLGCAEITNITSTGLVSFLDIKDNRRYLTKEQFDEYNSGCEINEIIKVEE